MRHAALLTVLVGLGALPTGTAAAQEPPVVVELFTSEGCSSCPPADAFLTELARRRPDVLPLAYHVTYWNGLGWRDPFSFDAATARQQRYAHTLGDGQVYTPEMVVNGTHAFVGSDRAEGLAEIVKAAKGPAVPIPLRLARDGDDLVIDVGRGSEQASVLLVGFDPEHRTPVGRGENGGRTLLESNIVRALTSAGRWSGSPLKLRQPVPAGERFAVLLQADDGRIIAAARMPSGG